MNEQKEARLLRSLAAALARDLAMPYQRLAGMVGVSRRTLYRIAPSREALFERLRQEAIAANTAAMAAANLDDAPFISALSRLTDEFVVNAALYEFWAADTWGKASYPTTSSASDAELETYHNQMARFFARGQREGHLGTDMPISWLLATYDGLLAAATSCRRSGDVEPHTIAAYLVQTFVSGLAATPRKALAAA